MAALNKLKLGRLTYRNEFAVEAEPEPAAIREVLELDNFGDVIEICDESPIGQHQYSIKDWHRRCIHCGEDSGL